MLKNQGMARKRTPEELQTAFEAQKAALRASADGYDAGHKWEALRLATSVYMLVHDGGRNSRSILGQLGLKQGLRFLCSAEPPHPGNMMPTHNLVGVRVYRDHAEYYPIFEGSGREVRWTAFSTWWENDPVFCQANLKRPVSRKNLVFNLRNKEGGAHYDPEIAESEYTEMSRKGLWVFSAGGLNKTELEGLELATMRQIAFELVKTLQNAGLF